MEKYKPLPTFEAKIYLGLKEGYDGPQHSVIEAIHACQEFCDTEIPICVTVMPAHFCYPDGGENGCLIGLINYPRFPQEIEELKATAYKLATVLKDRFRQNRVSIIYNDETITIE